MNKAMIIGRLGKDPDLKYTPSGSAVCNFTVATSEKWKDKEGKTQEKTEWHKIVVWGKLAEVCGKNLAKGRSVFLEGAINTRSWDDKDGKKVYTTEINAKTVQFLDAKTEKEVQVDQDIKTNASYTADDIPF